MRLAGFPLHTPLFSALRKRENNDDDNDDTNDDDCLQLDPLIAVSGFGLHLLIAVFCLQLNALIAVSGFGLHPLIMCIVQIYIH